MAGTTARRHHHLSVAAWILVALTVGLAVGLGFVTHLLRAPFKGYRTPSVLVEIPPGSSTASILTVLERGGVLRDRRLGLIALAWLHRGKTLKAGEYRFAGPRTPDQVIVTLVAGDVVTYRVTVPEGFSAAEVFALFSSQGFGQARAYAALFAEPSLFEGVPANAPSLEGFLFPDTYTVTRSMSAREITSMMTRQLARRLPRDFDKKAAAAGLTRVQAVTLASLVEKETALDEERPLVAAVYRNRLRKGMLLQCDPTTIYALKRLGTWRGTLARSELAVDDAYNTYVRPGLPPGPICNPGLASLKAAVEPVAADYLYFVAGGDGSHRFSVAYEEQQRNVALYLKERRENQKQR